VAELDLFEEQLRAVSSGAASWKRIEFVRGPTWLPAPKPGSWTMAFVKASAPTDRAPTAMTGRPRMAVK
jgi:hypothetical protein